MNKSDIRNKIQTRQLKTLVIHINEWDTDVIIKELNGTRLTAIADRCVDGKGNLNKSLLFNYAIIHCAYTTPDDGDEPIFTEDDLEMVKNLPVEIYSQLVSGVEQINNFTGVSKSPN